VSLCNKIEILLLFVIYVHSYSLWETVEGGQVQKPPCDDMSTNPVLVFDTDKPTMLVTVPLNLMTLRYDKYVHT